MHRAARGCPIMMSNSRESSAPAGPVGQPATATSGLRHALLVESAVFLCLLGSTLVIYSSTLVSKYGYLDDYSSFALVNTPRHAFGGAAALGRPLAGIVGGLVTRAFHPYDLSVLPCLRFLSIIGITLVAWSIYRSLAWAGWRRVPAVFVGFAVCTLPSSQVYAAWASCDTYAYAGFLGATAGWVAWASLSHFEAGRPARAWIGAIGAAILLLAGVTLYQPTAMLFWVVAAIDLLRPSFDLSPATRRRAWGYALVGMAALAGGWVIFKIGTHAYAWAVQPNRGGISMHPVDKAWWLISEVLPDVLNLQNIFPSTAIAWAVGAFIVIGLACYLRGPLATRIAGIGLAAILLPLAYLPNLLASESWASYRTQLAPGCLVLVLIFMALNGFWKLLNRPAPVILLAVLVLAAAISAKRTVKRYITSPQSIELKFVRTAIATAGEEQSRNVYFIVPSWLDTPAPGTRYDEFGWPSTSAKWVRRSIVPMIRRDLFGRDVDAGTEADVSPEDAAALSLGRDSMVLDMRKLRGFR